MSSKMLIESGNLAMGTPVIVPARSGAMTGLSAGDDCFGCRNIGPNPFAVCTVRVRWVTTTAFASAQCLAFRFNKVYGFTAVHSGGSGIAVQAHYRAQLNVPNTSTGDRVALTQISTVISNTAALTTATYTAEDTDEPDIYVVAAGGTLPAGYEDWQPRDGYPLVLDPDTGIVGNVDIALGASGVGRLYVALEGYYI
jgi:hypothetical protein